MNNTVDCKECNGMPPLPPELATPEAQMATACLLMTAAMKTMDAENKELREQNAKLRELVRDALRPKYDHTLRMPPAKWREYDADVLRRACELGIEVDR